MNGIIDLSNLRPPKLHAPRDMHLQLSYLPQARAWHWNSGVKPRSRASRGLKSRARAGENGTLDIWIYDDIFPAAGYFYGGYGAEDLLDDLEVMQDRQRIRVHLNSPGGDVFEGVAIYNLLFSDRAEVDTIVDGSAMSIASVIAQAGDDRQIGEASMTMIHNPWTIGVGEAKDFRAIADILDKVKESIVGVYESRAGDVETDFSASMNETTFYTGQESVDAGLSDTVIANKTGGDGDGDGDGGGDASNRRRRRTRGRKRNRHQATRRPKDGAQVSDLVDPAVEAEVDRRLEADDEDRARSTIRGEVVGEMADGADVESSIMNEIIDGKIECPFVDFDDPDERFDGMGEPIGLSGAEIRRAAESDGCSYGSTEDRSRGCAGCQRSAPRRNRLALATKIAEAEATSVIDDEVS